MTSARRRRGRSRTAGYGAIAIAFGVFFARVAVEGPKGPLRSVAKGAEVKAIGDGAGSGGCREEGP